MRIPREGLWALVVLGWLLLVLFALAAGPWLFTRYPQHGLTAEQELKAKNDVRTTLVQALGGLAVAGGLAVTYRTYRQNRAEQDRTYELRQAEQVNERYTKAVEQLGHEKAPVRLGALHSLDRLAQDNLELRPLVVDVFCAYLRMPYTPPMSDEPTTEPVTAAVEATSTNSGREQRGRDAAQELQVRSTAQRLLAAHLRCAGRDAQRIKASRNEPFWPDTSLDLTGAALVDLDFKAVSAGSARFSRATFHGFVRFHGATFRGDADFDGATFRGGAWFNGATFQRAAWFNGATFQGDAWFSQATFQGDAGFSRATFQGAAWFLGSTFQDSARFYEATFQRDARLRGVTFQGPVEFHGATFQGDAWFNDATFTDDNRGEGVAGAHVLRLDDSDLNQRRVWPNGFTVRPDPADPTRGRLVRAEHVQEPERPSPHRTRPADDELGPG